MEHRDRAVQPGGVVGCFDDECSASLHDLVSLGDEGDGKHLAECLGLGGRQRRDASAGGLRRCQCCSHHELLRERSTYCPASIRAPHWPNTTSFCRWRWSLLTPRVTWVGDVPDPGVTAARARGGPIAQSGAVRDTAVSSARMARSGGGRSTAPSGTAPRRGKASTVGEHGGRRRARRRGRRGPAPWSPGSAAYQIRVFAVDHVSRSSRVGARY